MRLPSVRLFLTVALLAVFPLVVIIPTVRSADPVDEPFTWRDRSDAPIDRVEGIGAQVGDQLFVMSGFASADLKLALQIDVYDLAEDRWTANIGAMPGIGVSHINPAVDGTDIWIAGGFAGDHPGPAVAEVWRYDTQENTWHPGPPLPEERAAGSLVLQNRTLHYVGGFAFRDQPDALDNTRTTHWALDLDDPAAGWHTLAPLPEPLGHLSGIALDGQIYAIGGQIRHDRNPEDLASVYAYDGATDNWRPLADLPAPRSHAEPGTLAFNGRIVLVGGRNNTVVNGSSDLNLVTMYDPERDVWIDLPQLPFNRIAPIAVIQDGELFVAHGGETWNRPQRITISGLLADTWEAEHPDAPIPPGIADGAIIGRHMFVIGSESDATLAFDLARGEWEPLETHPARPSATAGSTVAAFGDHLYVFGGSDAAATALQIYDPAEQTWRSGAPLPFAAEAGAAVPIGAFIYLIADDKAARYDPAADRWEPLPAGPPVTVRAAAAGTDGAQLYLFGGETMDGPVSVVQRYDPATDTWTTSSMAAAGLAELPEPRAAAGRALCIGGAFYLLGGRDASGAPLPSGVMYRVTEAAWQALPMAPTPRTGAAVDVIADRLYMVGGNIAEQAAVAALDVYNAAPGTASGELCVGPTDTTPMPTPTLPPSSPGSARLYAPFITR